MSSAGGLGTILWHSPVRLWMYYNACLLVNPVETKAVTSFVAAVLGDLLAQRLSAGPGGRQWR